MARKGTKTTSRQQPSAPQFRQQPPTNPYYPDLASPSSHLLPPPPYSEPLPQGTASSYHRPQPAPMSQVNPACTNMNYVSRYHDYPNQGAASVVIHQVPYNHHTERYNRRVRSFNNKLMFVGLIAAISSVWAFSLYRDRPCLFDFTVHKPNKDLKISINDVKNMHLSVAYISGFVVLFCLLKSAVGFSGKRHTCYLLPIMFVTFFATLSTGYLSYLAFYSPCALKTNEIFSNSLKTFLGSISDSLPAPDKGVFGESNVFDVASEDRQGVLIFIIDFFNFSFYFAAFLTSTLMC